MTSESLDYLPTDQDLVHRVATPRHAAISPREFVWQHVVERRAAWVVLGLAITRSGDLRHLEALESTDSVYSAPARRVAAWVAEGRLTPGDLGRESVRDLVQTGRLAEARSVVRQDSEWASLLKPPVARKGAKVARGGAAADFRANARWIRAHREDASYAGQWVALLGGSVVVSDVDRSALQTRLKALGASPGVLVVRMGGRS